VKKSRYRIALFFLSFLFLYNAFFLNFAYGDNYPIAKFFQYPLGDGTRKVLKQYGLSNEFGECVGNPWYGRHLAIDISVHSGTKVYAVGNGKVVLSDNRSIGGYGNCKGPGYVVITEHTLPDTSHICFLYGHVKTGEYDKEKKTGLIPKGSIVEEGQYIATIADYWWDINKNSKCGDSGDQNWDHLHWGSRKGPFIEDKWERYIVGYCKYIKNKDQNILWFEDIDIEIGTDCYGKVNKGGEWTNPINFIQSFRAGMYKDGWHPNDHTQPSQPFVDCYNEFKAFLGTPFDNGGDIFVHKVNDVWVQDFKQSDISKPRWGEDGESCLVLNEKMGKVFLLKEGFWGKYKEILGFSALGAPTSSAFPDPAWHNDDIKIGIFLRQNFEEGFMLFDGENVTVQYSDTYSDPDLSIAVYNPDEDYTSIPQENSSNSLPQNGALEGSSYSSSSSGLEVTSNIYRKNDQALIVVQDDVAHEVADTQKFLQRFDMQINDFQPFRYEKSPGVWVNRTNTGGANLPFKEILGEEWLHPRKILGNFPFYAPTGFKKEELTTPSQIKLCWQEVNDVEKYKIYRNNKYLDEVDTTYYIDSNITQGITYTYKVSAMAYTIESPYSKEITATVGPPNPPTGLEILQDGNMYVPIFPLFLLH